MSAQTKRRESVFERQGQHLIVRIRGVTRPVYGTSYAPDDDEHGRLRAWGLARIASIPRQLIVSTDFVVPHLSHEEVRRISVEQRRDLARELGRWLEE